MSWDRNAQGEFAGKRKNSSVRRLSAFRPAWNFALGSASDEESFQLPASRLASRIARSSSFAHMPNRLAQKGRMTSETLEPTQTPPGGQIAAEGAS